MKFVTSDNLQIENTSEKEHFLIRWELKMLYRHTSSYCSSLYCTMQILCFWQIEGLWQPFVKKVYKGHFSSSICSLHVSMSHFGNSHNVSYFFHSHICYVISVISDLWCYYCKKITIHWKLRWFLAFFSNKVLLIKRCTIFSYNYIIYIIDYSVNITFICTRKIKTLCDSLYCNICFSAVV